MEFLFTPLLTVSALPGTMVGVATQLVLTDCAALWANTSSTTYPDLVFAADRACGCEQRVPSSLNSADVAFATIIFGDQKHLCGVLTLGSKLDRRFPRIAIAVPPMARTVESVLQAAGWLVRWMPSIVDPNASSVTRAALWSKLNFWALVGYRRVLALDSDVLPLIGLHELLIQPHPNFDDEQVQVAAFREGAWPRWNSGVMLLKPRLCMLARLLRNATAPVLARTMDRRHYLGDQPVLNTAFLGQGVELSTLRPFHRSGNHTALRAATPFNSDYCRASGARSPSTLGWAFVHLMGRKPFDCPALGADCNRPESGFRCPRGHAAFGTAFAALPLTLQRACAALRGTSMVAHINQG